MLECRGVRASGVDDGAGDPMPAAANATPVVLGIWGGKTECRIS